MRAAEMNGGWLESLIFVFFLIIMIIITIDLF